MSVNTILDKEKLFKIFEIAEQKHINLFHGISKENFYKELDKVADKIESLSKRQIDYELMRLFALFCDGHTCYKPVEYKWLPIKFAKINDKFYIVDIYGEYEDILFKQVNKINGLDIQAVFELIKNVSSGDSLEMVEYLSLIDMSNFYYFQLLNIDFGLNGIILNLENKEKFISVSDKKIESKLFFPKPNYELKKYGDTNVIKIRMFKEDKQYILEQFKNDLLENLTQNENIIIDLRNNSGGYLSVVDVLENVCQIKNLKGTLLINEGCASATMFAIGNLQKRGFTLIGSTTGGCGEFYSAPKKYTVDKINFYVSNILVDAGCKTTKQIVPDIKISNTIQDYKNKKDVVLDKALKLTEQKQIQWSL